VGEHRPGYYADYRKSAKYRAYQKAYHRAYDPEYQKLKPKVRAKVSIQTVVEAFLNGQKGAVYGPVPCGVYVRSTGKSLYSYCTVIALSEPFLKSVYVTTKKYSVSSTSHTNKLKRELEAQGYVPTERYIQVDAKVPGRWGGHGPAWASSDYESVSFELWRVP